MLAGDGAAQPDGQLHDARERALGAVGGIGVGGVVHDDRMGVAVPGVRHHVDLHVARLGDVLDPGDHRGQLGYRDAHVLQQQAAEFLDRAEHAAAGRGERRPFGRVIGGENVCGTALLAVGDDGRHFLGGGPGRVGLHQQHGSGGPVEAHSQVVLDGVDTRVVHEFQHRRADFGSDRDDGVRGGGDGVEHGNHRRGGWLGRDQPQRELGDDTENALRSDEQLRQGQSRNVFQ